MRFDFHIQLTSTIKLSDLVKQLCEALAKVFDGRWRRSGDTGFINKDGYSYLRGRLDDVIIFGDINVVPAQVEETILRHRAVNECVVLAPPDQVMGATNNGVYTEKN